MIKQPNGAVRAAIYCRISDDKDGEGLGVERQEEDGRKLCLQRGWTVEIGRAWCRERV